MSLNSQQAVLCIKLPVLPFHPSHIIHVNSLRIDLTRHAIAPRGAKFDPLTNNSRPTSHESICDHVEHQGRMGKLEKLGRSIMKKLTRSSRTKSTPTVHEEEPMSTSSRRACEEMHVENRVSRLYILAFQQLVKNNIRVPAPHEHRRIRDELRRLEEDRLSGYGTDDTAVSSLPHLETEYESSFGYHSTSELSPREREELAMEMVKFQSKLQPRHRDSFKSTPILEQQPSPQRSMTVDQLDRIDPIDRFLRNNIYKTKLITTVFEAKNGGMGDVVDDVIHEIDRWFGKAMVAVACELHFSVPEGKRSRTVECRLKEKLLTALRENNKRLLYLKGMGKGKMPIKLAEAKTEERITKHFESDSIRGVYQRSYTRLLPYLHAETPEWHAPYWTFRQNVPTMPHPEQFLFGQSKETLASTTLISLNIIGLSIFGNTNRSCKNLPF